MKNNSKQILLILLFNLFALSGLLAQEQPMSIGIAGLSHGHARLVFKYLDSNKVKIVGIAESNQELIERFQKEFHLDDELFFPTLKDLLQKKKPNGVATFTSTKEHLHVVQVCAEHGVHVMLEKPLAISHKEAQKMAETAQKHEILLYTNFETSWHKSMEESRKMVFQQKKIGDLYKVVFHDGNSGIRINPVQKHFFQWLTDPQENGGGAVMDFGCYGINLINSFTKGEMPRSVYADIQNFKKDRYPHVDDDALLVLNYSTFQCIIQASWNWEIPRKDAEFYGNKGYVIADHADQISYRLDKKKPEQQLNYEKSSYPVNEPFEYFVDLLSQKRSLQEWEYGSIQNNLLVAKILDAAKKSARKGKMIKLKK